MSEPLNFYGQPIISPEYFDGAHVATVPPIAGLPPVCSCGWTRHEVDGEWFELADHLRDMDDTTTYADEHECGQLRLGVPTTQDEED